jgi:hypothetical protein
LCSYLLDHTTSLSIAERSVMMRSARLLAVLAPVCFLLASSLNAADEEGFVPLFDGKSLDGWKASENPDSFRIEDGKIVANGPRAHLFYTGDLEDHDFVNFHFKAEVMTMPSSNSGLYFHTKYQESGWPAIGYEVQVNQTHRDPKKSSGLYGVRDIFEAPAKDNEWYTQEIIVRGKHIITKVNGKTTVDYTEPDDVEGLRKVSSGTFAIQAHDPVSKVFFRNIRVKPLDD